MNCSQRPRSRHVPVRIIESPEHAKREGLGGRIFGTLNRQRSLEMHIVEDAEGALGLAKPSQYQRAVRPDPQNAWESLKLRGT